MADIQWGGDTKLYKNQKSFTWVVFTLCNYLTCSTITGGQHFQQRSQIITDICVMWIQEEFFPDYGTICIMAADMRHHPDFPAGETYCFQ